MIKKLFNKIFKKGRKEISFKQGIELTDLPICTFYQGEQKINFLLDTGATDSIISKSALEQLNLQYENTPKKSIVFGMEGNKTEVAFCKMSIMHAGKVLEDEFLICNMDTAFGHVKAESGVNLHGILGSKFFNKFKYILDFKELIAYSKL